MLKKYLRKGSLVAGLMALALVLSLLPANVAKAETVNVEAERMNAEPVPLSVEVTYSDVSPSNALTVGSFTAFPNIHIGPWQNEYSLSEGQMHIQPNIGYSFTDTSDVDTDRVVSCTANVSFTYNGMSINKSIPCTITIGAHAHDGGDYTSSVTINYTSANSDSNESSSSDSSASSASAATPAADTQAMEKAAQAQTTQNFVNAVVKQNTATAYTYGSVNAASAGGTLPVGGVITMGNPSDADYARADAAILPIIGNAQKMVKEVNVNDLNGNLVHDFGGNVTLSAPLPFAIAPGKTMAVYVIEGNNAVGLPSYVDGDRVFWTTPHCSTFVFVEADQPAVVGSAATSGAVTSPKTANDMGIYLLMLAIAAASLTGVFMIRKRS